MNPLEKNFRGNDIDSYVDDWGPEKILQVYDPKNPSSL
jgi:hypothetical protein